MIGNSLPSSYTPCKATTEDLRKILDTYCESKATEDIDYLQKLGGEQWLKDNLLANFEKGISSSEVEGRRAQYGANKFKRPTRDPGCCGSLTGKKKEIDEEEKKWQAEDAKHKVEVCRDGVWKEVHYSDLVVGDLVKVTPQLARIHHDAWIIETNGLSVDESEMTGEPQFLKKATLKECVEFNNKAEKEGKTQRIDFASPILLSGSKIISGEGKAIVLLVGEESQYGKISPLLIMPN